MWKFFYIILMEEPQKKQIYFIYCQNGSESNVDKKKIEENNTVAKIQ